MPLQHLYPELGVDLGERAYGSDCRLYTLGEGVNWPVIIGTLFDEFVLAHTLGWWAKVKTFPHASLWQQFLHLPHIAPSYLVQCSLVPAACRPYAVC